MQLSMLLVDCFARIARVCERDEVATLTEGRGSVLSHDVPILQSVEF